MPEAEVKVLISDAESRKSFDIINIYREKYKYETIPCASKDLRILKYIYGVEVQQLRVDDYKCFVQDMKAISTKFRSCTIIYIPASEKTTLLFYDYIMNEGCDNFSYLLPDKNIFELTRNKYSFQKFCEAEKLPIPQSFSFEEAANKKSNALPLIIKPRIGAGSVGIKYLKTESDLAYLKTVDEREVLIQKKITSDGTIEGAFFLSRNGEVINAFTHRRIRTFPQDGGVTVFSESTYNKDIISIGEEVLRKISWSGFAMIEFMYDTDEKQWKIIELNPRLWGSVLLSAFNESGMLQNYVLLCVSDVIQKKTPLAGKKIRWYYPYEFINLAKGNISVKELLSLNRDDTCYINGTYSGIKSAIFYQLYLTFNIKSIKRFFQKTVLRK